MGLRVDVWQALLLVLAGIGGGLSGTVAGIASLVTYPALLAIGLSPVDANVTNTVALVFVSIGSAIGSRPELSGQGRRVARLGVLAMAGGAFGGVLLLATPSKVFEQIVPYLIGFGSLTILSSRRPKPHPDGLPPRDSIPLQVGVFVICVYGGYFGAAAGIFLLALMLLLSHDSLPRSNALKTALLGFANGVAAIVFVIHGSVDWSAAIPMAVGLFVGGRLGPIVVRHSPARVLRIVIALAGVGLAIQLALKAYG